MPDMEPTYVRMFSQVQPVLKDQSFKPVSEEMYLGYRRLALPEQKEIVDANHLEYDLTIVPPMILGDEYNKTMGHYHANLPGTEFAHPEMYEVNQGHALFLIQKMDPEFKNVIDVIAMEAHAGDKVIYPPNYGHILINLGSDILVVANWLSTDYKPMYEEVGKFQGMAYYVVRGQDGKYSFVKNPNYTNHPAVRLIKNEHKIVADFGFKASEPMYLTAMQDPKKLEFLNKPQGYLDQLARLVS